MNPTTETIVNALIAGGAALRQGDAPAVVAAYQGMKSYLRGHFARIGLTALEKGIPSGAARQRLAKRLELTEAADDPALLALAQELMAIVAAPAPSQPTSGTTPRRPRKVRSVPTPAAAAAPLAPHFPAYIYGLHEGGEGLMLEAGRPGWILQLAEVGLGNPQGGDFSGLAAQGLGIVTRLNHGYGSTGTLPKPEHYGEFARACASYVVTSQGCHIWIVGNEPNHEQERPDGQPITPQQYVSAYGQRRAAIRGLAGHEGDLVLVAGPAPWNILTAYPGNEAGDWTKYLADQLAPLKAGECDGVAIHTYTHAHDPGQISGDFFQGDARYAHLRNEFRTYRDFLAAIPARFRNLPVLITEADPTEPGRGWGNGDNNGWVRAAYAEIADWNGNAANQPIQALILYRWPDNVGQPEWSLANRAGVQEDFRQAVRAEPAERFRVRGAPTTGPVPSPTGRPQAVLAAVYTNQQVINAFFNAAHAVGIGDWDLLHKAGLNENTLAQDRPALYGGARLEELPNLTPAERAVVRAELIKEIVAAARRTGSINAPAGLNLRVTGSTQGEIITRLNDQLPVQILGEQGVWLFVAVNGEVGYVHSDYVQVAGAPTTGPVPPPSATGPLSPPADQLLTPPPGANGDTLSVISTWNRYGGALAELAPQLQLDPATAVATLSAESGGRGLADDGRMIIRFEVHLFHQRWGATHEQQFGEHFAFNRSGQSWTGHLWRPVAGGDFQPIHGESGGNQHSEWSAFTLARQLDETAAMQSISMGAAQIVGFNHADIGYASVQEMFAAFQGSERAQIEGFFSFVRSKGLLDAVRNQDFDRFAAGYNGPGNVAVYSPLIRRRVAAFQSLRPAAAPVQLAAEEPVLRGVAPAAAALPTPAELPQPLNPEQLGGKTLAEADPKLYAAWRQHILDGYQQNNTMFSRILEALMSPYNTTILMYKVLFGVGVLAFIAAAWISGQTGKPVFGIIFGGMSLTAFLTYFLGRPLQALEENLQFITWLGIVYNTYWTRLAYTLDTATAHQQIEDAAKDAVAQIKELLDKHADFNSKWPGLR